MIKDRVNKIQQLMKEKNIDVYVIPTADYHASEYIHEYFNERKYISGFTGSSAMVVITQTEVGLWTDGRYFLQAETQLEGSGIILFKMGEENVPTVDEYIKKMLPKNGTLGADGRMISATTGNDWTRICADKNGTFNDEVLLVSQIWDDRPTLPKDEAFYLEEKYSGESASSKLERVRAFMKNNNATAHLLTTLDDIAWLLNIRGNDIPCNPVVLSYVLVTMNEVHLFVDETKIVGEIKTHVPNLVLHPYNDIYEYIKTVKGSLLYDASKINYALNIRINAEAERVMNINPEVLMKSMKNTTEVSNLKKAHIKDGLAITKFIYWLKEAVKSEQISEVDAIEYLEKCREENDGYLGPSFSAIGAYNSNAAMMHYNPKGVSTPTYLKDNGFYLIDSGGQYYEGTTDITRTISLGKIDEEWKKHYTLVLKGVIKLSMARFLYGCTGVNLDILARGSLWDLGIDYQSGTGHGVGYLLNVHEAPNGFRWKVVPERNDSAILEEGMVTTIEPGVYIEGSHGIRIENELVCQKSMKNEYGQFMDFETITVCPIDLEPVIKDLLDPSEIDFLNFYHKHVYEILAPLLSKEQSEWLRKETRAI